MSLTHTHMLTHMRTHTYHVQFNARRLPPEPVAIASPGQLQPWLDVLPLIAAFPHWRNADADREQLAHAGFTTFTTLVCTQPVAPPHAYVCHTCTHVRAEQRA